MVAAFLEIAVGQTPEIAVQFLQATNWKLDEAIQLFYVQSEGGLAASSSASALSEEDVLVDDPSLLGLKKDLVEESTWEDDEDEIRAPLPVKREALYENTALFGGMRNGFPPHEAHTVVPFRNFNEEVKRPGIWEQEKGDVAKTDNNLASLYRPPFALMFTGSFEKAKDAAKTQNKWLLANVQSTREFSSHMLNRDTWANEAVEQTVGSNFIFWQIYDDTEEGRKICTYYKLDSAPVVLVLDPVTGQKMHSWRGMVQPERLLEDLLPFMDNSPKEHHVSLSHKRPREGYHQPAPPVEKVQVAAEETTEEDEELLRALAASMEGLQEDHSLKSIMDTATSGEVKEDEEICINKIEKPSYPPLPEEPKVDRNLLCRVGVRLPDGRRVQRNFLLTDPIQLLWSLCQAQFDETEVRPFRLTHGIPGANKILEYNSNLTFGESGLSSSMVSVTWE